MTGDASLIRGFQNWAFPSELFLNLKNLDITFPTLFADTDQRVPSFEVLRVLFSGAVQAGWGGFTTPLLNSLSVRMHEGEDEEIGDARALVVSGAQSWRAVAASLGRFAPHLQSVDILITCESARRCAVQDQAVERQFRQFFQACPLEFRFMC